MGRGPSLVLVTVRRALYRIGVLRVWRPPVPTIVIGNLTAGGTGKTPLVIALARALIERGRYPGPGQGSSGLLHDSMSRRRVSLPRHSAPDDAQSKMV